MEDTFASCKTLATPEAANILADPAELRLFAPFIGAEKTVSEVARETDTGLSTMYRRVERYLELDLLTVTRERPRKGRALKLYRAVADSFYAPYTLTRGLEADYSAWHGAFDRAVKRGLEHVYGEKRLAYGLRVYRNEAGVLSTTMAKGPDQDVTYLEPDAPSILTLSHDAVYLNFQDAKRLQKELYTLAQSYFGKGGDARYLVRVNLVPVPEDSEYIP